MTRNKLTLFLTLLLCVFSLKTYALGLQLGLGFTAHVGIPVDGEADLEPKRIGYFGDSTVLSRGANPLGTAGVSGAHVNSISRVIAAALSSNGIQASSRSIVGMGNHSASGSTEEYYQDTPDVGVTLNGWGKLGYLSIGGDIFVSATPANIMRYDFDNVDRGAIGLPIRTYGDIEYRVDGGVWILVSEDSGAEPNELRRIEIDFGAVGAHYVEFRATAVVNIYVVYCEAWNSSDQIIIIPWGARGYSADYLNRTTRPWSYKSALSHVPFDAVIINIGINDVKSGASTTQTSYTDDVETYIQAVQAANASADCFLQIPNDIDGGLDYVPSVLTTLAGTYGCTILDSRLAPDMSDYATAGAAGKMFDDLHPNDLGYAAMGNYFQPIIQGVLYP